MIAVQKLLRSLARSRISKIFLEGARRDSHSQREHCRKGQYYKCRMQAERQGQIHHPGNNHQWQGRFLGIVVDERTLPAPTPPP